MAQTIDARLKLDEGTEGTDANHFAGYDAANRVLLDYIIPRFGLQGFEAQLDALALTVEGYDLDFDFLIDLQDIGGGSGAAPAQIADVDQAINAA